MPETCDEFIARTEQKFQKDLKNGKLTYHKHISRKRKKAYIREAWDFWKQLDNKEKIFVIERLRTARPKGGTSRPQKGDKIEYRLGYYIVKKNGEQKGKWGWGQFTPIIPAQDLRGLLRKMKALHEGR